MIRGTNIILSIFKTEQEIDEYVDQYMDLQNRSKFDHTELYSKAGLVKSFHEYGLWSDKTGTMLIKTLQSTIIGTISFNEKTNFEVIVGYRIFSEDTRGLGYGTEALTLFSKYLFETKPIERITLEISADNKPSMRIAEKCGYKNEGIIRNAYFYRGNIRDMKIYGLLRSELK